VQIRNSWGSWWGEDWGFARFALGVNTLGIESNGCNWGVVNFSDPWPTPSGQAAPVTVETTAAKGEHKKKKELVHPLGFAGSAHVDKDRSEARYKLKLHQDVAEGLPPRKYVTADKPCSTVSALYGKPEYANKKRPQDGLDLSALPAVWDWRAIVSNASSTGVTNFLTATRNQQYVWGDVGWGR
jgi:hypothetical protein